jgi:hypothetical protein
MGILSKKAGLSLLTGIFLLNGALVEAVPLRLAWDANTEADLKGYTLMYGTSHGAYTTRIDVGKVTSFDFNWLPDGTYYFAVQAYNTAGVASGTSNEVSTTLVTPLPGREDLDGDGRADIAVWHPATGTFLSLRSGAGYNAATFGSLQWGNESLGDKPFMADLDGDGIRDYIVWRASTGTWHYLTSLTGYNYASAGAKQFGNQSLGDVPMLADLDGDRKADFVVWRASTGTWYWLTSSSGYNPAASVGKQWGNQSLGDVPLLGDFDGDGRADLAVWRPTDGTWYWLPSSAGYSYASMVGRQWGNNSLGDVPMVADMDGDRRGDLVVWRSSTGTWYWLSSSNGFDSRFAAGYQWGNQALGDRPVIGDFDGDGRGDLTVWRESTGTWYWLKSSSGYSYSTMGGVVWGVLGDVPIK